VKAVYKLVNEPATATPLGEAASRRFE